MRRRNGSPAYLRAPAEAWRITGLCVSSAASRIAWNCSRLFTLNAGTPYPFSAAWSSTCLRETSGMDQDLQGSGRNQPPGAGDHVVHGEAEVLHELRPG